MTAADLDRLERELGIALPESYRLGMEPFPIPDLSGTCDGEIWDEPGALIFLNQQLHSGRFSAAPWPEQFFCIGEWRGDYVAIDLKGGPDAPTWWVGRGSPEGRGGGKTHAGFRHFVRDYVERYAREEGGAVIHPWEGPARRWLMPAALGGILLLGVLLWLWLR